MLKFGFKLSLENDSSKTEFKIKVQTKLRF